MAKALEVKSLTLTALCKIKGELFTIEISPVPNNGPTRCPLCNGSEFRLHMEWMECSTCMDFAVTRKAFDTIQELLTIATKGNSNG
jgi:hypothetical protein